jgi:predicted ABC-type ATPase
MVGAANQTDFAARSIYCSIALLARAAAVRYEVGLFFVALRSAELNIALIAQRVAEGGHHIPSDVVLRRHESSIRQLAMAIRLVDGAMIYDNSLTTPMLLIRIYNQVVDYNNLDPKIALHQRIAATVAAGLGLPEAHLLQFARATN